MREILFRGKRKDNGEWVCGDLLQDKDLEKCYIEYFEYYSSENGPQRDYCQCEVIPETVGQYTGLTDKNGKKIFEGDIVKIKDYSKGCALNYEQPTSNWVVKWNDKYAQFTIDYMSLLPYKHFDESEVIGNIHDNPELLKGGVKE